MNSRLAAGMAIAILTIAVVALAAQDESEFIQSPEVLSQSVSAAPSTTTEPVDHNDLLPDESPTTSHVKTEPVPAVPDPTTTSSSVATAEESSTTAAPPADSTTTLAPVTTVTTTAVPSGGFDP
jgi:hypothetical protein